MRIPVCLAVLTAAVLAQDPVPPPGGFDVNVSTHAVTWSDGYQSMMDVYAPTAVAPNSGWPGVLAIHGGGGQRDIAYLVQAGYRLASAGYVVYAYDVRGNAITAALNPGVPPDPSLMLRDSAESHALANGFAGGIIDQARLAVTGFSQGCVHSLEAAAWAGKLIPPAYTTTYPPIVAVYGRGHTPARVASTIPNGRMVKAKTAVELYQGNPAWFAMIQAGDYAALEATMLADPQLHYLPELQNSSVAIFSQLLWHDSKVHPNEAIDGFLSLPATTPFRLFLTTDGHNTPSNAVEVVRKHDLRRQWFDFHMKGQPNGIDQSPLVEAALFPANPAPFQSTQSHWPHRFTNSWPPATPTTTWYLRANETLSTNAPLANETGPVVSNAPVGGYDLTAFCLDNGWTAVQPALAGLPLDRAIFDTPPSSNPIELFGRPVIELWVDATIGDFQVTAAIYRVDQNGSEMFLGLGTDAVRGAAAGRHMLQFDLMDLGTTIDAGDRIRVAIENVSLFHPPGYQRIRMLPEFTSYDLTVVMEPGFASRVELPAQVRRLSMTPAVVERPLGNGFSQPFATVSSPQRAGHLYLTVLGVSGSWPGTPLPGATIPMNWDVFSDVGLTLASLPGNPWLAGASGVLDAQGSAVHQLSLDPVIGALFVDARITFSTIALDPVTGAYSASGPCDVLVWP